MIFAHFAENMIANFLEKKFLVLALDVRSVLKYMIMVDMSTATSIFIVLKKRSNILAKPLDHMTLARGFVPILNEFLNDQTRQILRAPFFVAMYIHTEKLLQQFSSSDFFKIDND